MKFAALQLDISGEKEQVEERAARLVREAKKRCAMIACLPEHWIPGESPDLNDSLPMLIDEAKRNCIWLIAGADFAGIGKDRTVDSVVISPEGKEVGRQRKIHLFGREKKYAKAGDGYAIFEAEGVKFGIAICHDLVYPEVARIFALKGAEVIFSPARIVKEGIRPWHLYVQARALENRLPVISPNCTGLERFTGGSIIADLRIGKENIVHVKKISMGKEDGVLLHDADTKELKEAREERLLNRRVETYKDILKLTMFE